MSGDPDIPFYDYWTTEQTKNYDYKGFDQITHCPFCAVDLTEIHHSFRRPGGNLTDAQVRDLYEKRFGYAVSFEGLRVFQCAICGWWAVLHGARDGEFKHLSRLFIMQAVMKTTPVASQLIPVQSLAEYLARNHNRIYGIHPRKMEELVQAVLSEHLSCEVRYVGGSGDRGTDLLLVMGEELVPVQVKRRSIPHKVESVSVLRDLLGVIFRDQRRKGMIVTTADHFSEHARRDVAEVISKGLVESFDLIDVHTFFALLDGYCGSQTRSFLSVVPAIFGGHLRGLTPYDEDLAGK